QLNAQLVESLCVVLQRLLQRSLCALHLLRARRVLVTQSLHLDQLSADVGLFNHRLLHRLRTTSTSSAPSHGGHTASDATLPSGRSSSASISWQKRQRKTGLGRSAGLGEGFTLLLPCPAAGR